MCRRQRQPSTNGCLGIILISGIDIDDPQSRVAIETLGAHGELFIAGEVTSKFSVDFPAIAEKLYRQIGYRDKLKIKINVIEQSPDIAMGVDSGGAEQYLPKALVLVHQLTKRLEKLRTGGKITWLGPDGKAQITVIERKIITVLVSCQHLDGINNRRIRDSLILKLFKPIFEDTQEL